MFERLGYQPLPVLLVSEGAACVGSVVAPPALSGFRSAVAWVPLAGRDGSGGTRRALLAAGPSGADLSTDEGRTWTRVSAAGFHAVGVARANDPAKLRRARAAGAIVIAAGLVTLALNAAGL